LYTLSLILAPSVQLDQRITKDLLSPPRNSAVTEPGPISVSNLSEHCQDRIVYPHRIVITPRSKSWHQLRSTRIARRGAPRFTSSTSSTAQRPPPTPTSTSTSSNPISAPKRPRPPVSTHVSSRRGFPRDLDRLVRCSRLGARACSNWPGERARASGRGYSEQSQVDPLGVHGPRGRWLWTCLCLHQSGGPS
jgi:hypothetical protein